jgi:hypothetical protein
VNLRAGLDDLEKRKFLTLPELELRPLDRPARSVVAIPTTLSRLLKENRRNTNTKILKSNTMFCVLQAKTKVGLHNTHTKENTQGKNYTQLLEK